jgi:hypothetical protein
VLAVAVFVPALLYEDVGVQVTVSVMVTTEPLVTSLKVVPLEDTTTAPVLELGAPNVPLALPLNEVDVVVREP